MLTDELEDKLLTCKECQKTFPFTIGEQGFYIEKGLTNEPKRCPDCRKALKNQDLPTLICADCGAEFKHRNVPTDGRAIYCQPCFIQRNPRN